ncbi:5734_t:CDS:2 [Gigaspora margarita]|uniref:5734_t:CDS:1 n=1 Tax=Gigaspora margarita TaxID=4874 RepID=A0ABN7UIA7_GIGMA|nr:5734_t:CDS:2 [Gigaspora margarita]
MYRAILKATFYSIERNSSQEKVLGEYIRTVSQYNPKVIFLNSSRSLNSLTLLHNKRGFFAKNSSHTFLVTTGHFNYVFNVSKSKKKFSTIHTTRPRLIGKLVFFSEYPHDIALIDIKRMSKHIRPSSGVFFKNSPNNLELFINNNGTPVSTHGAHLCKAGFRTSVTCGYTESFNGFYMFTNSRFLEDMIFVNNMETLHGDSGGPLFAFTDTNSVTINGILSGTIKDRSPVSPFSYIIPLDIILNDINLELDTDPIVHA